MAEPEPKPERYTGETLPAWSLPAAASAEIGIGVEWPERVTRGWALGGATGAGVRGCIPAGGGGSGADWRGPVPREWALGGSTGAGIRVCILDSGVQPDHRLIGELEGA